MNLSLDGRDFCLKVEGSGRGRHERTNMRCAIIAAVTLAIFTALYLGVLNVAVDGRSVVRGFMALWGGAGAIVVISMAAVTLSELIGTMLERAGDTLKRMIDFQGVASRG